eukprot:3507610-Rhodomonas_salina.1
MQKLTEKVKDAANSGSLDALEAEVGNFPMLLGKLEAEEQKHKAALEKIRQQRNNSVSFHKSPSLYTYYRTPTITPPLRARVQKRPTRDRLLVQTRNRGPALAEVSDSRVEVVFAGQCRHCLVFDKANCSVTMQCSPLHIALVLKTDVACLVLNNRFSYFVALAPPILQHRSAPSGCWEATCLGVPPQAAYLTVSHAKSRA